MRAAALALTVAIVAAGGSATATTSQRWDHYRSRLSGNVLVVKGRCLAAEDSAAHLRLISYRDRGGHVVYGCKRHGY